jgi:sensor histidine kinase YesM
MLFCDKHFEKEFLKVEKWIKYIGIPFFTIMSTLFLLDSHEELTPFSLFFHTTISFLGVLGIWFSTRYITFFFRKRCGKMSFAIRLALQIFISCAVAIIITIGLEIFGKNIYDLCGISKDYGYFAYKNLLVTVILLTFLINTIYESFYLFHRLSETLVEAEVYKKESIEAQYQNLTSRLNPHFLFNSLNTLTTIVEEDPKKAVKYIQELSVVYRYVLNSQKMTWADLRAEMEFTQSYISLLKMRFEENLQIRLDVCEDHFNYHILAMTIQLLIENAVKHNEISNTHPLVIDIFCEEEMLIVANKKQKRNIIPSTTKVGLHNITERYRFLVDKEVIVDDIEHTFTVKIPLIKTISDNQEHIKEYS